MMKIDSNKVYKIPDVKLLTPGFDGFTGWITVSELNVLDPNCDRYDVIQEAVFEDGTIFMLIQKC